MPPHPACPTLLWLGLTVAGWGHTRHLSYPGSSPGNEDENRCGAHLLPHDPPEPGPRELASTVGVHGGGRQELLASSSAPSLLPACAQSPHCCGWWQACNTGALLPHTQELGRAGRGPPSGTAVRVCTSFRRTVPSTRPTRGLPPTKQGLRGEPGDLCHGGGSEGRRTHVLHTAMVWQASPVQNSETVLYCRLTWWKNVVAVGGERA